MNLESFLSTLKLPELDKIPKNIIYLIIAFKVINAFEKFISKSSNSTPDLGGLDCLKDLGSLAGLGSLKDLGSLAGLGSLKDLGGLGSLKDLGGLGSLKDLGSLVGLGNISGLDNITKCDIPKPKSQFGFMTFFLVFILIGSVIVFMNKLLDKISISLMTNDMSYLCKTDNIYKKNDECKVKCPFNIKKCPFFSNKIEKELEEIIEKDETEN